MKSCVSLLALALATTGCLAHHAGPMAGEPAKASYAQLGDTRVRYTDEGEGPVVVLVHGFASSLETWELVKPALLPRHRVITLDLKGFGWTDRPEGDYSPDAQAALILALLDARGVKEAAFVGHSWGASIVLALAGQAPARVTKLALYDAWAFEAQLPTFFHWARQPVLGEALFALFYDERPDEKLSHAFFAPERVPEKLIEDVELALQRPGTKYASLAAVRSQVYAGRELAYRKVTQPTLLLWGREDRVTTLPFGEALVRLLPNAELKVYERCGHFPMLEAAPSSTRDLQKFLDGGAP